jgi:nucleotide-binding universal stress UspA family protein
MNVFIALDCTSGSEDLIGEVLEQPWPAATRFEILHVSEASVGADEAESALAAAVFSIHESGFEATRRMWTGNPKTEILEYAELHRPDLIVVGARRRSNLSRFILGSTSSAIVRHACCSVEVVRPRPHDFRAAQARRIMLATDGSTQATKAAEALAARPWPDGTEVLIVSVVDLVEPPTVTLVGPGDPGFPTHPEDLARAKSTARNAVGEARRIIGCVCPQISESIPIVTSGAKSAILEEAENWDADCIFVGSHGVSGVERFLIGSVSEAVAIHAHCSVVVVR